MLGFRGTDLSIHLIGYARAELSIMNLQSILSFLTNQPWAIPTIGIVAASLAFLVGRRLAQGRPAIAASPMEDNSHLDSLLKKTEPERRSMPRRKGNSVDVHLTDESKQNPVRAWVVDRSMGGLCLIVEKPLTKGIVLNVRPVKAHPTAPWMPIEICSCRAEDGSWEVGCRFVTAPQWNDLLLFG
jgi:hypothetical protein